MTELNELFLSLGNQKRLDIVRLLSNSTELMATSTIATILGIPASLCSKHLKELLRLDIVARGKAGPFMLYSLKRETLQPLIAFIKELDHAQSLRTKPNPNPDTALGTPS